MPLTETSIRLPLLMFTLAHFSDPHIGPLPSPTWPELMSKRITGYINYKRNRAKTLTDNTLVDLIADLKTQKPDHIALTGDLINIALDQEIQNAAQWLGQLGDPHDISLIGGNHDAYVPGAFAKAKEAWRPYFLGDGIKSEPPVQFPYLRRRGDIVLIGLSTAVATAPFMATGTLGNQQLEQAKELLTSPKLQDAFRVILIHHPPQQGVVNWHKRLTDGNAFLEVLSEVGAELVLHGHIHKRNTFFAQGPAEEIPIVSVPSASSGLNGKHEPARYNLFKISKDTHLWKCVHIERGLKKDGTIDELNRQDLF